jgi:hypothetical protein
MYRFLSKLAHVTATATIFSFQASLVEATATPISLPANGSLRMLSERLTLLGTHSDVLGEADPAFATSDRGRTLGDPSWTAVHRRSWGQTSRSWKIGAWNQGSIQRIALLARRWTYGDIWIYPDSYRFWRRAAYGFRKRQRFAMVTVQPSKRPHLIKSEESCIWAWLFETKPGKLNV